MDTDHHIRPSQCGKKILEWFVALTKFVCLCSTQNTNVGALDDGCCQTNPIDWRNRSEIGNENPIPLVTIFALTDAEFTELGGQFRTDSGQDNVLECAHSSVVGNRFHPDLLAKGLESLFRGIPCRRSFKVIVRRPTPSPFWGVDCLSTGRKGKEQIVGIDYRVAPCTLGPRGRSTPIRIRLPSRWSRKGSNRRSSGLSSGARTCPRCGVRPIANISRSTTVDDD